MPQVLGDDRADRVALAVIGLLAEEHEVGVLALECRRERVAGGGPNPKPQTPNPKPQTPCVHLKFSE